MSTRSHSKNSCEPSIQISWLTGNTQIGFGLITLFQSCSWVCRDTPPPALKASGSSRQSTLQAISTRGFYTITCTYLLFALLKIFPRVSKNSKCTQFVSHFKDYSLIHVSGLKTYLNIFLKKTKRRYLCRETDFIKTSSKCICHDVLLKFQHQMLFLPYIQKKKKKKILNLECFVICHLSLTRDWKKYFSFLTKNKKRDSSLSCIWLCLYASDKTHRICRQDNALLGLCYLMEDVVDNLFMGNLHHEIIFLLFTGARSATFFIQRKFYEPRDMSAVEKIFAASRDGALHNRQINH